MEKRDQVAGQLRRLVRAKTGDAGADVADIQTLPGHAGFSYSFLLTRSDVGAEPSEKLGVRIAPEGVRIARPADVVRQAKILRLRADTAVRVPPILWFGDEPEFFGGPYLVDAFIDGFK